MLQLNDDVLRACFTVFGSHRLNCDEKDFRDRMLSAVQSFSESSQNGLFLNSCFAHCQSERQDTWFANDSPTLNNRVRRCFSVS